MEEALLTIKKQCFGSGGQASGAKTRQVPTGIQNGRQHRVRKGRISLLVQGGFGRWTSRTDLLKSLFHVLLPWSSDFGPRIKNHRRKFLEAVYSPGALVPAR